MTKATATGHMVGATYLSSYWGQEYIVLSSQDFGDWRGETVTVQWSDGRTTTHCTNVGRDQLVSVTR